MRGNIDSVKGLQILQLNVNKSSDVLQNLLNDTKLVDYRFLLLIES